MQDVSAPQNISYCQRPRGILGRVLHFISNHVEMFMAVVRVYRKSQMVCIDGRKKTTGRLCEHRR